MSTTRLGGAAGPASGPPAGPRPSPSPHHQAVPPPGPGAPERASAGHRRFRWRPGTALRLAGFHTVVLVVVLGVVVAALARTFTVSYESVAQRGLVAELHAFQSAAQQRPVSTSIADFTVEFLQARALPSDDIVVVALAGHGEIGSPGAGSLLTSSAIRSILAHPPAATTARVLQLGGAPTELIVSPLTERGRVVGTFLASADLSAQQAERSRVVALSIAEAAVALAAGAASAYFLLRRLLRTVGRITTTAEEIGAGELDRRLGDQGTDDEVGKLATTFDSMLEKVSGAMTMQRRLLSDVSHQLRTPLTVARGHLEVLERTELGNPAEVRDTVDLVLDELDHMRALVERLLLLGSVMEPDFLAPEPVDLRAFLADLHATVTVIADRRFELAPVPDVVVVADPAKLRGALLNLVENATKATEPGDSIAIAARVEVPSGRLVISVEDSGPGIAPRERQAVLDRFARPGARDSGGSGLGLAIVKAVSEAHGGAVSIGDSRLGGCAVAIVFPPERVSPTWRT